MTNTSLRYLLLLFSRKERRRFFLCGLFFLTFVSCPFFSDSFAVTIKSRAAVVMDASTDEVLYSKEPSRQLPPASTTKLMTAILALEKKPLSDIVTVTKNASHVRPFKAGLKEGSRVTVEALLYAALLKSANDAAVALAEAVAGSEEQFVSLMNQKAAAIGAIDTRFINATGLPGPDQHTTALDLAKIMACAITFPKLKEIIGTLSARVSTEEGRTFALKNTDRLLWSDEEVIGGKTGFTLSAGHCFVCAAENSSKRIIVAVLGSPNRRSLWKETQKLLALGFGKQVR
jgi:serine-type D-Ala-D-Ala carboxypeptidase (penicillin-binding protein 5/6)